MSRSQRIARDVLLSLGAQRSRVLLMMLGLAVGVGMLSAVIVIGQGTRERILGLVERHGLDMVMVRAGGDVQVFAPQADRDAAEQHEHPVLGLQPGEDVVAEARCADGRRQRRHAVREFGVLLRPLCRSIRR